MKVTAALVASATTLVLCAGIAAAEPGYSPTQPLPVPSGAAASTTSYDTISCPTTTSCTGAGVTGTGVPFATTETSGTWGTATTLPLPSGDAAIRLDVACGSVGSCVAAGSYETQAGATVPILVEETSGAWGAVTTVTPPVGAFTGTAERATMLRPWCASAGNCEVLEVYESPGSVQLMTTTETAGVWSTTTPISNGAVTSAVPVIEPNGYFTGADFTCTSVGDCVAVTGTATWSESAGTWSAATALPAPTPLFGGTADFLLRAVACATPTTCLAVGEILYSWCPCRPSWNAAVAMDTSGTWAAPSNVEGGLSDFDGISCASSQCVAVGETGSYDDFDPYDDPLSATWSDGTWSANVEPIPLSGSTNNEASYLGDVSCASSTQCVAIGEDGEYTVNGGPVDITPYTTVPPPSAPRWRRAPRRPWTRPRSLAARSSRGVRRRTTAARRSPPTPRRRRSTSAAARTAARRAPRCASSAG